MRAVKPNGACVTYRPAVNFPADRYAFQGHAGHGYVGCQSFSERRSLLEFVPCIFLLLPLFSQELHNSLALGFVLLALEKLLIMLDVFASDEAVYGSSPCRLSDIIAGFLR